MKRHLVILLLSLLPFSVRGQSLSVESFQLLENDLTANTYGTMERDQNGEVAALLKVVTLEKGLVFDGGMLGIVKTVQKPGEIWVYVPYGLQRITIAHPELGVLRDYYFPIQIEKSRTYELKLFSERPKQDEMSLTTNVKVSFENAMTSSDIYLNGIKIGSGSWSGMIAASTYLIEVKQKGYRNYSTTITLRPDDPNPVIKLPKLEPITGTISVTSDPKEADVYINENFVGITPLKKEGVRVGTYSIEIRASGYKPYRTAAYIVEDKSFQSIDAKLIEKNYMRKSNFYVEGSVSPLGTVRSSNYRVGFYAHNFNIEAGFLNRLANGETIYWVTPPENWKGTTSVNEYTYYPYYSYAACLGWGILLGKKFRITPQAGAVLNNVRGLPTRDGGYGLVDESRQQQTTYVIDWRASMRFEWSFIRHISLVITPSYEMPFKMGELASYLNDNSDFIKKWYNGFAVSAGLELYF